MARPVAKGGASGGSLRKVTAFEGAASRPIESGTIGKQSPENATGNSNGAVANLTVANFTCLTLTSQQGSARKPWPSAVLQQALSGVRLVSANPDSEQVCADTAKPSDVKPMSKANTIETKGFRKPMVQKYGKTVGENKLSMGCLHR